jgi:hypothetical protein
LSTNPCIAVRLPRTVDGVVEVPHGTTWQTPWFSSGPVKFRDQNSRLIINGPPEHHPARQIFDTALPGQVAGTFGGEPVDVGWWSGYDWRDGPHDIAPSIQCALQSRRPDMNSRRAWNKIIAPNESFLGALAGGIVTIPAGVWSVRTPIEMAAYYCRLVATGKTRLCFKAMDGYGIQLGGRGKSDKQLVCPDSDLDGLVFDVHESCTDNFSTILVDSAYLERTTIDHCLFYGAKRSDVEISRKGSCHRLAINQCEAVHPARHAPFLLNRAVSAWIQIEKTTVAGDRGRGIDWSSHGQLSVQDCHFESQSETAISLNDERGGGHKYEITADIRADHNYRLHPVKDWDSDEHRGALGALVKIDSPNAHVHCFGLARNGRVGAVLPDGTTLPPRRVDFTWPPEPDP